MILCKETRKPLALTEIKNLIVDRSASQESFHRSSPLVCVGLDGVLFKKIRQDDLSNLPVEWLKNSVEIEYPVGDNLESCTLLQRPGAADLMLELAKYANPMIYSSLPEEFIEEALLKLSIAQGDPDDCTDLEYAKATAYDGHYVWSRDQCIDAPDGYRKTLGTLAEFSDHEINDIWLIDHRPDFVDFPSHVVKVAYFTGDPADRDLFRVIEQIFID